MCRVETVVPVTPSNTLWNIHSYHTYIYSIYIMLAYYMYVCMYIMIWFDWDLWCTGAAGVVDYINSSTYSLHCPPTTHHIYLLSCHSSLVWRHTPGGTRSYTSIPTFIHTCIISYQIMHHTVVSKYCLYWIFVPVLQVLFMYAWWPSKLIFSKKNSALWQNKNRDALT